jgi:hypothetical protein
VQHSILLVWTRPQVSPRDNSAVSYVYSDALVDESVAKKGFTARLNAEINPSRCAGWLSGLMSQLVLPTVSPELEWRAEKCEN